MREEFVFFLGRYRALDFYTSNLWEQYHETIEERFNRLRMNNDRTNLVSGAFAWIATPQGPSYWEGIDKQWEEHIKHQLNN